MKLFQAIPLCGIVFFHIQCSDQCDEHYDPIKCTTSRPKFDVVFHTEKIAKEAGEFFSFDVSLKDKEGNEVTLGEDLYDDGIYLWSNFYLKDYDSKNDTYRVRQWIGEDWEKENTTLAVSSEGQIYFFSPLPPPHRGIVMEDGTKIRYSNFFYAKKITSRLAVSPRNITEKNSIHISITENTGVSANFVPHKKKEQVTVQVFNGDRDTDYEISLYVGGFYEREYDYVIDATDSIIKTKKVTLDVEGKDEVEFDLIEEPACKETFTALLRATEGDNTRVITKEVDLCLPETDRGQVVIAEDGSLTFIDKDGMLNSCSSDSDTNAKHIKWSYTEDGDLNNLKDGGTLERVPPEAEEIDLGTIENYNAELCYHVVVESACLGKKDDLLTISKVGDGC